MSRAPRAAARSAGLALLGIAALVAGAAGDPVPSAARVSPAARLLPRLAAPDFQRAAADSDTSLDEYLGDMADSTADWFGITASPTDTAGLDSALAENLDDYEEDRRANPFEASFGPYLGFNRVDGPVYGAFVSIGERERLGKLSVEPRYAVGPNDWMGRIAYRKSRTRAGTAWSLQMRLERETTTLDREHPDWTLTSLRAFLIGKDRKNYLRREGFNAEIERSTETMRLTATYRDMDEEPRATTTTWNLTNRELSIVSNLPAAPGHARELGLEATVRLPFAPIIVEASHQATSPDLGGDFDYRRNRVAAAGEFGIGGLATLVPQASYGRLSGVPVPQQAFYLGGAHSLRSLSSNAFGGTHRALGRVDLIGAFDVLERLRIPHPAAIPIQAGAFAAIGAAWGVDPFGGPTVPGGDWPRKETWMYEAGLMLLYQPGIPDPTRFVRVSYSWPLGPARESTRWSISFTRALDLVGRLGND